MVLQKPAHAFGVALRQFAQPPADRLLDEPLAILGQKHGPAEHPLGVAFFLRPRQGEDQRRAPRPQMRVFDPGLDRIEPAGSSMRQRDATLARLSATAQPSRSARRSVTKRQTLASGSIDFRARIRPATIFKSHTGSRHSRRQSSSARCCVRSPSASLIATSIPGNGTPQCSQRDLWYRFSCSARSCPPSARRACNSRAWAASTIVSGLIVALTVVASAAKQSRAPQRTLDCFVAIAGRKTGVLDALWLLAMTAWRGRKPSCPIPARSRAGSPLDARRGWATGARIRADFRSS